VGDGIGRKVVVIQVHAVKGTCQQASRGGKMDRGDQFPLKGFPDNLDLMVPVDDDKSLVLGGKYDTALGILRNVIDGAGDPVSGIHDLECPSVIEGDGTVEMRSNCGLFLDGSVDNRSSFVLRQGATLVLSDLVILSVTGIGSFIVEDYAKLVVDSEDAISLLFGGRGVDKDDIKILVRGGGMISLKGDDGRGATSVMSLYAASIDLDISQGGILSIQNNGWLEINSMLAGFGEAGSAYKGNLRAFNLNTDGRLYLGDGGKISFGDNRDVKNLLSWMASNSFINSKGFIEYKTTLPAQGFNHRGFVGALQVNNAAIDTQAKAESLVRTLVNEVPALAAATVFTTPEGEHILRLKNAQKVTIVDGDVIQSEDSTGNVFGVNSDGRSVTYRYPSGNRVS